MSDIPDLVEQVAGLTDATTDLLDATNVSKQTLDEAVDSATGSAGSASTDADTATTAKNESLQARNESVQAKDDAVAVVYEGDAILTPTPGSIPIADSKAKIDIGWLPFGKVNNPYSGVIGSVAKSDLFAFYTDQGENWANRIQLNKRSFNIGGRFVETAQAYLELPEAEDTADRAIAFDDVFIDWNGNTDSYRSITPHRTNTGYDADKIAAEHGYSKVSNGLYKTGDSYALLLCRVARRNNGAYDPLWNPEGSSRTAGSNNIGETVTGGTNWYSEATVPFTSKDGPFIPKQLGDPILPAGKYGATFPAARPDSKRSWEIHSDDVTPLYLSAKNVVDRQALLFDSFNKAVAGETFSGAEGTQESQPFKGFQTVSWQVSEGVTITSDNSFTTQSATQGVSRSFDLETLQRYLITVDITISDGTVELRNASTNSGAAPLIAVSSAQKIQGTFEWFPPSDNNRDGIYLRVSNISGADEVTVTVNNLTITGYKSPSARPQFLACDIIGSLDAMPQEWLEHGIPGNWLAVGEEGEDLIPDGTEKNFKLSRKCLECYLVLYTEDNGNSWSDVTSSWKSDLESSANARSWRMPEGYGYILFYRTAANPFELTINRTSLYGLTDVAASNHENRNWLVNNTIGKVPVGLPADVFSKRTPLVQYLIETWSTPVILYPSVQVPVMHPPINLTNLALPAGKVLGQLSNIGSVFSLQVHYKEMRRNDESWGDDDKFNIVDNQSTTSDLNGEEVIVGQKCLKTQFQFYGVTL